VRRAGVRGRLSALARIRPVHASFVELFEQRYDAGRMARDYVEVYRRLARGEAHAWQVDEPVFAQGVTTRSGVLGPVGRPTSRPVGAGV